ncbi:hypothetical protein [uncultured Campylobacter sp.]|uniref:hypothetical protein n=1 Tax=uncultured Campylobacter sp. TaxID=218934 RepID=UPI003211BB5D
MKFARIFTHSKDVWRIYIYDINGEKNGVTDTFDIKNISRGGLGNLLADAAKYLKFTQEIIEK